MQFTAKVLIAFRLKLPRKRKRLVAGPPFREAVKPPRFVGVFLKFFGRQKREVKPSTFAKAAMDKCGFVFSFTRRSRAGKTTPTILAERENFTSEQSERLHQRPKGVSSQARLPEFGEDVKKSLRLLSEERLTPREVKPCGFVRHFLSTKNGGQFENEIPLLISLFSA